MILLQVTAFLTGFCGAQGEGCTRLRKFILIHDETLNLGHLDTMTSKVTELFERKRINKKTQTFMKENIAELSRGWCIVEKSERREKR